MSSQVGASSSTTRTYAGTLAFPDGRRRNEARAEQPMAEQVGDPFRVFDIRLTARNFPDMLRIGRHVLQSPFQKGVDRLPVHPGALHGYLGANFREQPFPQAQQLARARAQCPNLLLNLPIPQSNQQTGHHGSLYAQRAHNRVLPGFA